MPLLSLCARGRVRQVGHHRETLPALAGGEVQLAAIGPITADTLTANGLPCHIQPAEYTIPALVAALKKHFAKA